MHHPYQSLQVCSPGEGKFLLAGSGSKLFAVSLEDGSIVSTWPNEEPKTQPLESAGDEEEPSPKKRKISTIEHEDPPNIIAIAITSDQHHAVVVTAEDKAIRVFSVSADGQIQQLSKRSMPKRPCAIVISPDDKTIISGDKFGDVYSLPMLPTAEEDVAAIASLKPAAPKKTFTPTATESTVHSKANRTALEAQKKQALEGKQQASQKEPLQFAHELILGHVSMLTDVVLATVEDEKGETKPKSYIITSDRDEHIRISRGLPQAFVIEGFCLGHNSFINKLCLAEPDLLVSGGGDEELYVWNWLEQKFVKKVSLVDAVVRERRALKQKESKEESEVDSSIAVSGLWICPGPTLGKAELLIAVEGVPALFHLPVTSLRDEKEHVIGFIPLVGNPLDLTVLDGGIIISVDTIHEPGSTSDIDASEVSKSP
ncbi:hypothetical protein EJ08DRAFT_579631 [Tothia fuscella]|uniref:Transfer RNA methyltransferase 82 n=1 Tax=Tothia fuscella TaxID=1048955 RepID=A0A9P4U3P2_9PEZI|nr:hypothetical protein EJ08DRAFT_579631 [Tothia fuscella]